MTVYLVGAGPGDPELLTLKAARLLGRADVVLHDRLVSKSVLALAAARAVLIPVGKDPDGTTTSQTDIEALLVEHGRRAETVVRLKGGDPFVFGRGSEEAATLRAAGIDVQIVPGVSSALAGPAAAGVPVTARGMASGVTIVTGHRCEQAENPLDWAAIARSGTTIVVMMGARHANAVATRLLDAGMRAAMPVSIITKATTPDQQIMCLTLGELRSVSNIANPSVITIGEVAGLSQVVRSQLDMLASAG